VLAKLKWPHNRREKGNESEVLNELDFKIKSEATKDFDWKVESPKELCFPEMFTPLEIPAGHSPRCRAGAAG